MCLAGCSERFDLGVAETVRSAATSRSMAKQQLLDHQPRLDRLPQPDIVRDQQHRAASATHEPAARAGNPRSQSRCGTAPDASADRHSSQPRSAQRRSTRVQHHPESTQVVRRPDLRPHERQMGTRNGRATRTPTRGQPRGSRSTTGGAPRRSAITPGRAAVNPPEATGGEPESNFCGTEASRLASLTASRLSVLDPVRRSTVAAPRSAHHQLDPVRARATREPVPGRTRLVHHPRGPLDTSQPRQKLVRTTHHSTSAHLARFPVEDRDRALVRVHVEIRPNGYRRPCRHLLCRL